MADIQAKKNEFAWVKDKLTQWLKEDPEMAFAMGAIRALTEVVKASKAETMMGLQIELEAASRVLGTVHTSLSLKSGAELFLRYVTRAYLDIPDFNQCKSKLIERGEQLRTKTTSSRKQIAFLAEPFIRDGMVLLVHGFSRVVCSVLIAAAAKEKRFTVYVTESRPEPNGHRTVETLLKHNLPVTLISDSTVGAIMDKVDMVLVGAEAVVENGGIINKVGTYQIGIVAKALGKPVYVAAESFKMIRLFPLRQRDIPNRKAAFEPAQPTGVTQEQLQNLSVESPDLDFTPPHYITLLFSDLGVLTPSAVSDELIKLYG
eukprot:TRINITY_DN13420_c0_g1_i1.p1 TRINITY_DN13420_c0_g1~~TRINITY_DN13420_c0_g1_i1.p1  ORF type:complete len:317 (+),score=62.82 TRINITY_DN13420_c0_g1_i1:35-985(+)